MKKKPIIDAEKVTTVTFPTDGGQGVGVKIEETETIKISKMKDDDEFVITGKQLKQLQGFWKSSQKTGGKGV